MSDRARWPVWPLPVALIVAAFVIMALGHTASPTAVSVFPIPGARVASPQSQVVFRGLPAARLGEIVVTGSLSGRHSGRLVADSDGQGASFLPAKPFTAGESVTVRTSLRIRAARRGTFRFTVATPAAPIPAAPAPPAARTAGDVTQFQSRPDLSPAAVEVAKASAQDAPGDIFIAPQNGPLQSGPMIVNNRGNLVWFHPLPSGEQAADFRVQTLHGQRVLTWWQGRMGAGIGFGEDVIDDSSYNQVAVVRAGNGLSADLHEFALTPQGTALITAYYPVYWNAASMHGSTHQIVVDATVQEIDIKTGLVLFQWDSLDHVPITQSQLPAPTGSTSPFDYFHVNSIQQDSQGNLIISARNTWAAYDVDHRTGRVVWSLGGKSSSYRMGTGTAFAFQHDVRVRSKDDRTLTAFDDGAGPPTVHPQSRAITLRLDPKRRTVTLVGQVEHSPHLLANFEGDMQVLKDGDEFVGWGQQPYFTEFGPHGQVVFDARFVDTNATYRAYRFAWQGAPRTVPAITASTAGAHTMVYASWNGATAVASWRVLAGTSASSLRAAGTAPEHGFETSISVATAPYVAVQALDARGRVLATSKVIQPAPAPG